MKCNNGIDIITRDCADFGVYACGALPANARSALSDLMVLANRVLIYASKLGFASVRPAGLADFGGPVVLEATLSAISVTQRPGKEDG